MNAFTVCIHAAHHPKSPLHRTPCLVDRQPFPSHCSHSTIEDRAPWTMIQQLSRELCCATSFPDTAFPCELAIFQLSVVRCYPDVVTKKYKRGEEVVITRVVFTVQRGGMLTGTAHIGAVGSGRAPTECGRPRERAGPHVGVASRRLRVSTG